MARTMTSCAEAPSTLPTMALLLGAYTVADPLLTELYAYNAVSAVSAQLAGRWLVGCHTDHVVSTHGKRTASGVRGLPFRREFA
jgi:hypothetical protein